MNKTSPLLIAGLTLAAALSMAACQRNEGPAERAGKSIDNAANTAERKVENAGDKVKDAVNDAKK